MMAQPVYACNTFTLETSVLCPRVVQKELKCNCVCLPSHLCYGLLGAFIQGVFAHVHELFKEQITDLRETSTGWLH